MPVYALGRAVGAPFTCRPSVRPFALAEAGVGAAVRTWSRRSAALLAHGLEHGVEGDRAGVADVTGECRFALMAGLRTEAGSRGASDRAGRNQTGAEAMRGDARIEAGSGDGGADDIGNILTLQGMLGDLTVPVDRAEERTVRDAGQLRPCADGGDRIALRVRRGARDDLRLAFALLVGLAAADRDEEHGATGLPAVRHVVDDEGGDLAAAESAGPCQQDHGAIPHGAEVCSGAGRGAGDALLEGGGHALEVVDEQRRGLPARSCVRAGDAVGDGADGLGGGRIGQVCGAVRPCDRGAALVNRGDGRAEVGQLGQVGGDGVGLGRQGGRVVGGCPCRPWRVFARCCSASTVRRIVRRIIGDGGPVGALRVRGFRGGAIAAGGGVVNRGKGGRAAGAHTAIVILTTVIAP